MRADFDIVKSREGCEKTTKESVVLSLALA